MVAIVRCEDVYKSAGISNQERILIFLPGEHQYRNVLVVATMDYSSQLRHTHIKGLRPGSVNSIMLLLREENQVHHNTPGIDEVRKTKALSILIVGA